MNISGVGEMGVGETGVGEMGQIIGETGVGEMGVGETGTSRYNIYEFEFFIFRLHLESDVSVGGIVFLLFGLFVKVN